MPSCGLYTADGNFLTQKNSIEEYILWGRCSLDKKFQTFLYELPDIENRPSKYITEKIRPKSWKISDT